MYYDHFGLNGPPFQFTPTADALYLSREHREALAFLEWSVLHEPTGFAVLVGESGVGKSTLVCSVIARYCGSVDTAIISNPRLTFEQMITLALSQLGVAAGGLDKFEMIQRFMRLLDDRQAESSVAMIFDEAQELSDEIFGELRLLSNQGMAAAHTLRIVLVGQPELLERLSSPQLHALNQRIGARAILNPMQLSEAREYVGCHLQAQGARLPRVFAPGALRHLIGHSHGNPRRINVLCHNAMLTAYGAHRKRVDLASARNAVADYENLSFRPAEKRAAKKPKSLRWVRSLLLATVTAAIVAAFVLAVVQRPYWPAELFGGRRTATARASAIRSDEDILKLDQKAFAQPSAQTRTAARKVAILPRVTSVGSKLDPPAEISNIRDYRSATAAGINHRTAGPANAAGQTFNAKTEGRNRNRIYTGETVTRPTAQNTVNDQAIP
jgi:type II secretory pathway predicted ATPase ExeA